MTHPTATQAETASRQGFALIWSGAKQGDQGPADRSVAVPPESIFYSPVTNFLEMSSGGFHYSVIGGIAMIALAPDWKMAISYMTKSQPGIHGLTVLAPWRERITDDASYQIGPVAASNRRNKGWCKGSWFCLWQASRHHARAYQYDANR